MKIPPATHLAEAGERGDHLGIGVATIEKNCDNCMRQLFCEGKGRKCYQHQSLSQKLQSLRISTKDWERFSEDWEDTRNLVRAKLEYGSRQNKTEIKETE